MQEFGMASLGLKAENFIEPGIINQIGQPPLRIVILNEIDGVPFSEPEAHKKVFTSGKIQIVFIQKMNL